VMERPYTKLTEGYDEGIGPGRLGRLVKTVSGLVGK